MSPGYYSALGNRSLPSSNEISRVRLYWNLAADGAAFFVHEITSRLNQGGVPFGLKVLNDPRRFARCDAGVLYLAAADFCGSSRQLVDIYVALRRFLKPRVPALTKMLAPGLGLAEDPPGRESFGLHRCALLARGIIRAHKAGTPSTREKLRCVQDSFRSEGLRLDRPFLNSGAADIYELRF